MGRHVEGALSATNESGAKRITEEPPASAWTNEWNQPALDELEGEDLDLTGRTSPPSRWTSPRAAPDRFER